MHCRNNPFQRISPVNRAALGADGTGAVSQKMRRCLLQYLSGNTYPFTGVDCRGRNNCTPMPGRSA